MKLQELFESTVPYKEKTIDPALLTFDEYYKIANEKNKFHPSGAYSLSVENNNDYDYKKPEYYPQQIKSFIKNNIKFTVRLRKQDKLEYTYYKKDPDGKHLRDENNNLIPFTKEELEKGAIPSILKNRYEYTIGVFTDDDGYVGGCQDEWGCVLVQVADEYRGFGIGPIIGKIARELEPSKTSGGFTPEGYANFKKVYAEFVREYLRTGMYTYLIKSGKITRQRVNEIIKSADLKRKTKNEINLKVDPADWLLYVGDYGDFIIYDKKIVNLLDEPKYEWFKQKMIIGISYVSAGEKYARIKTFNGINDKVKKYLMTLNLIYSKNTNTTLVVEPEDIEYVDKEQAIISDKSKMAGYESYEVKYTGQKIDLTPLGIKEKQFRKSFDQYDEFLNQLLELSYTKWN